MAHTATSLRGGKDRLLDLLQSNRFWLVDAIPSSTFPFWVLGAPFMGFQTITMPEITLEVDEIKQVNSMYKRYIYSGGAVGPITLTRGARVYDDSFYQWVQRAMRGIDMNPRNLLLIQYTNINLASYGGGAIDLPVAIQAWEIAQFLPGRAWLLWDCLDEQTEILTSRGWRGWSGVSMGDMIYALNRETGELELVPVEGYVCRPRGTDRMVGIQGRRFNFRTTDKHRFVLSHMGGHRGNVRGPLRDFTGGQLPGLKGVHQVPISGLCKATCPGINLTDDELRLVAWHLTDGHFKDSRLVFSQAKAYKDEIRELLRRLGLHFTERVLKPTGYANGKPLHQFGVPRGTGRRGLAGWDRYAPYLDKDVSPLLHQMTRAQFEVFWTEMVKGDGTFRRPGELRNSQLYCSRKSQSDALQWMATVRGFAVSVYERDTANGHRMYCLTLRDEQWMDLRAGRMMKNQDQLELEPASPMIVDERVWCVNNRLGTLVTRRGGHVMIMGNCIPTRYKAGTDLDAMSGEVSIMELDIQPHAITEFALLSVS